MVLTLREPEEDARVGGTIIDRRTADTGTGTRAKVLLTSRDFLLAPGTPDISILHSDRSFLRLETC